MDCTIAVGIHPICDFAASVSLNATTRLKGPLGSVIQHRWGDRRVSLMASVQFGTFGRSDGATLVGRYAHEVEMVLRTQTIEIPKRSVRGCSSVAGITRTERLGITLGDSIASRRLTTRRRNQSRRIEAVLLARISGSKSFAERDHRASGLHFFHATF